MVLSVAMSGSRSYPFPNPDPARYRAWAWDPKLSRPAKAEGRGQEMACSSCVALVDHGGGFGQAVSATRPAAFVPPTCVPRREGPGGPRIVEWKQRTTTAVSHPLRLRKAIRRRRG